MSTVVRQGDILLRPVAAIPTTSVEVPADPKLGVVLAYGEGHGFRHALPYGGAVLYANTETGAAYVDVKASTTLDHLTAENQPTGDHAPAPVEPGKYEVIQQRQAEADRAAYRSD